MTDLQKVSEWMMGKGYATGHGDTIEDLLKELELQVAEREREACAKVAESYEPTCDSCPRGVAIAIRSSGIDLAKVGEVGVWGEWVGLTEADIYEAMDFDDEFDFAHAIEAKLKEKNT